MQRWGLAVAVVVALLPGCFDEGSAPPADGLGPPSAVTPPLLYDGRCSNALLFQFVEYADTDPYLPPGFHPRDPQAFLGSPAAFGKGGVVMSVIDCLDAAGVRHAAGSVAIFVEEPVVDVEGLRPATFDFFEVERVEPPGPFTATLASVGWPMVVGEVDVNITLGMSSNAAAGTVEVTDGEGQVAFLGGTMNTPMPLGNATVRFWHDGPQGLGYFEYSSDLQALVGPAYCFLREGTAMADFARSTPAGDLGPAGGLGCPPGEPIMATFPDFRMEDATAVAMPGAHAR